MNDKLLLLFGARVKELRLKSNLSQEKLAEKSGFHRTYIGMIERGERNPSLKNVNILAKAFNITLEELMKGL